MTTPNIEELITYLRSFFIDENVSAIKANQIANALQSQAERIKDLELDLDIQAGSIEAVQAANSRLAAERDTLRAELAQGVETDMINLPEPVAWFANYGGNVYTEAQLKQAVRDALDAQGVEDAARYRWLRDYLISPSTHFDDLIVSADKAETLNGVIDAARAKGAKK